MRLRFLLPLSPWLLSLVFLLAACVIPYSPETRGWACQTNDDCTPGLLCAASFCRPACTDVKDCLAAKLERCLPQTLTGTSTESNVCVPPCFLGDKRPCYNGPERTEKVGICRAGEQQCTDQLLWGPCTGALTPQTEVCNEKDDDCDGQVDNGLTCECKPGDTRACYSGSSATKNVGICKEGVQVCRGDFRFGPCTGEIKPEASERCNGIDDDCNGQIDDALTDTNKACDIPTLLGPCKEGRSECVGGRLACRQLVTPIKEDCNGKDDDCDGKIDNNPGQGDFSLSRSCFDQAPNGCRFDNNLGRYLCTAPCRAGAQRCLQAQQKWDTVCDGQVLPKSEDCNGQDDDCDGKTDEQISEVGKVCQTANPGVCRPGRMACENGKLLCKSDVQPSSEICNNKDDDCDGSTDNGASICPSGQVCQGGQCR